MSPNPNITIHNVIYSVFTGIYWTLVHALPGVIMDLSRRLVMHLRASDNIQYDIDELPNVRLFFCESPTPEIESTVLGM